MTKNKYIKLESRITDFVLKEEIIVG